MKALLQDWPWIVGVSLLLAIPTYGFTTSIHEAVIGHLAGTLIYIGLLLLYGQGFVIEGALCALILTTLFAVGSHLIHRESVNLDEMPPNQTKLGE